MPPVVAAARPVDAVEAFEHPVEVALRDADTLVDDADLDPIPFDRRPDLDRRPGLAVLDGVLHEVADGRHELAPIAVTTIASRGIWSVDRCKVEIVMSRWVGQFAARGPSPR